MSHETVFARFKGVENSPPPTEEQRAQVADLRDAVLNLALWIDDTLPEGRYKATALTELETAAMFAVKGVFRQ